MSGRIKLILRYVLRYLLDDCKMDLNLVFTYEVRRAFPSLNHTFSLALIKSKSMVVLG